MSIESHSEDLYEYYTNYTFTNQYFLIFRGKLYILKIFIIYYKLFILKLMN